MEKEKNWDEQIKEGLNMLGQDGADF